MIFNCFTFNKSINKEYNDVKDLSLQLNETGTTLNTISKVYQLLREKLRSIYHEQWKKIYEVYYQLQTGFQEWK